MDEATERAIWRAERAIGRVILRYARAVDRRDFEGVRECFHPAARIHYGDWFSGDRAEAMAFLEGSIPQLVSTLHVFGTPWIEIDWDSETATVETYAVNSATYPPGEGGQSIQNVSGTQYFDRFAFLEERWAILERRNRRDWAHNLPDSGEPAAPIRTPPGSAAPSRD